MFHGIRITRCRDSVLSVLPVVPVTDGTTRNLQKSTFRRFSMRMTDRIKDKGELGRQTQAWSKGLARFGLFLIVEEIEYLTMDVNELSIVSH